MTNFGNESLLILQSNMLPKGCLYEILQDSLNNGRLTPLLIADMAIEKKFVHDAKLIKAIIMPGWL